MWAGAGALSSCGCCKPVAAFVLSTLVSISGPRVSWDSKHSKPEHRDRSIKSSVKEWIRTALHIHTQKSPAGSPGFSVCQGDLLRLVTRCGSKLFRFCNGARCPARDRYGRSRSVTFHQHRNHRAFGFLHERQLSFGVQIDADEIAQPDLPGCNQVRQREYQVALDCALQVTRT